jgi:hypothetical protein
MRGWKGVLGGVLGLIALQVLVSSGAAEKTQGLMGLVVGATQRLLDPSKPAIPDLRPGEVTAVAGPARPSSSTTPATPPPATTTPRYEMN